MKVILFYLLHFLPFIISNLDSLYIYYKECDNKNEKTYKLFTVVPFTFLFFLYDNRESFLYLLFIFHYKHGNGSRRFRNLTMGSRSRGPSRLHIRSNFLVTIFTRQCFTSFSVLSEFYLKKPP